MLIIPAALFFTGCNEHSRKSYDKSIFEFNDNMETRWSTPDNRTGVNGSGGKENYTAKGHPYDSIPAGASYALLDIREQGIINRIWITISDRSPEMLRSLKIEMFWDGETKPAVSVPFGDFFGNGLGKTSIFKNALFANTEGRSFSSFLQMPFKKGAKIVVTNESKKQLNQIFYDVNYNLLKTWNDDYLYFHAYWNRDTATALASDFELLPSITGKGRYLGANIGVNGNPLYKKSWFGEGEVKIYLDGDKDFPTLNGTGTEDYIGTAYGQGKFINTYTGCTIADDTLLQWAFYRFHLPDPVFFKQDCRITLQQLGGDATDSVAAYQKAKAPLIPVATDDGRLNRFYKKDSIVLLDSATRIKGWTNFYRRDDVSATAYFYLDKPMSNLPVLQPVYTRTTSLRIKK
ncbi:MAG: glycoside hydrolase family 172 protein [Ferruginibacter sp.]